jgi:hypothetical protein
VTLTHNPGAIKRFRRTPWRFQETFQTPLQSLAPFVATITTAYQPFEAACVIIDEVIMEPRHLIRLLINHSLQPEYGRDWSLGARGLPEVQTLLEAIISDWVNFAFVPAPKPFVIYADHDEYLTVFANSKSGLNPVVAELSKQGFKKVQNYERQL